jgi:ABC-type polysaccharide/polyol phosphate transport system ATPase subunit
MNDFVVDVQNLSKRFKLYSHPWHRSLEWLSLGRISRHVDHWALRDISFRVERGECFGIVGPNGAGKSTLLKIISRSLYPTFGNFQVRGRVVSLLELGTGFHPDLTGVQNIYNSARLLGFSDEDVAGRIPAILDFAELGDFVYRPLNMYSSGMYVRLAFSLFACLDPDVYIIDEALAVGDSSFQKKCIDRIHAMLQRGVTILFVSHDLWRVESLCNRAIYLDGGRIKSCDSPNAVVKHYLNDLEKREGAFVPQTGQSHLSSGGAAEEASVRFLTPQFEMYANSPLKIRKLWVRDTDGHLRSDFSDKEGFEIVVQYDCALPVKEPIFRVVFALPDERRVAVIGWYSGPDCSLDPGIGWLRFQIEGNVLYPRRYILHSSIAGRDGVVYDTHYGICEVNIRTEEIGPIHRLSDDLATYLKYTVKLEAHHL